VKSCFPTLYVVAASPMAWTIRRAWAALETSSATMSRSFASIIFQFTAEPGSQSYYSTP
jgi:hypothetical protein